MDLSLQIVFRHDKAIERNMPNKESSWKESRTAKASILAPAMGTFNKAQSSALPTRGIYRIKESAYPDGN
jgi:hypothetical protein